MVPTLPVAAVPVYALTVAVDDGPVLSRIARWFIIPAVAATVTRPVIRTGDRRRRRRCVIRIGNAGISIPRPAASTSVAG